MSTSGFDFQRAQMYLAQQNQEAVKARKDNATYINPEMPQLHERRCMAVALGRGMYNVDFMDGEGDMVVELSELALDNPPETIVEEVEVGHNITQEEKEALAEEEIPSRLKILITGDRKWADAKPIREFLSTLPSSTIIIHGGAKGADEIAGRWAGSFGMEVRAYPADWSIGKAGGVIRNTQMLEEEKPDVVVYFHNSLATSKGTKDMVEKAEKAGVRVINGNPSVAERNEYVQLPSEEGEEPVERTEESLGREDT